MIGKKELVDMVAEKTGVTKKDAAAVITETLDTIGSEMAKGEKVQLVGFGTFETRERQERKGRNPKTGEEITIKASKTPAFKAGKQLRDKTKK